MAFNSKKILLALTLLGSQLAHGANLRTSDAQQFTSALAPMNYILNSGAESNILNITNASSIVTRTTTTPLEGKASYSINATATSQLVVFLGQALQPGIHGGACEASFVYSGDASLYTAYATLNGTTVSSVATLLNISSGSQAVSLNFPCGVSATDVASVVIASTGDGAAIKVDSVYVGEATNIGTVAQATWLGRKTMAVGSGCNFTKAANNWNNFTDVATCATPTFEGVITGSDKRPNVIVPYRGAGIYRLTLSTTIGGEESGSGSARCGIRVSDGTNTSQSSETYQLVSKGNGRDTQYVGDVVVNSSSSSTMTFEFQMNRFEGNQNCNVRPITEPLSISVEYIPSVSQTIARLDAPGVGWTAFTPTGSWTTNTTYTGFYQCDAGNLSVNWGITLAGAPTSANLTINLPPSFTIDTTKIVTDANYSAILGQTLIKQSSTGYKAYPVYASSTSILMAYQNAASGTGAVVTQIAPVTFASGNTLTGSFTVPVTASSPCPKSPQVLIPGSVYSSSAGVERVERVTLTGASSNTSCASSPCTVQSQTGSWISSITRSTTGTYSLNISTGTFSAAPTCVCSATRPGTGPASCTAIEGASATSAGIIIHNGSGTAQDGWANIICQGPR